MSDDSDCDIPDLVPADIKKVPITIITGFLGAFSTYHHHNQIRGFVFSAYQLLYDVSFT